MKAGIIGIGNVGSHVAMALAAEGVADELVLIDHNEQKARSERRDILDGNVWYPREVKISAGDYSQLKDADILVIALADKPKGHTELDRRGEYVNNLRQIREAAPLIRESGFHGIIVSITNPCDCIAQKLRELLDYPARRIFGTGTSLDSSRLKVYISDHCGVPVKDIHGFTMGEHGSAQFVPWSQVTINGVPYYDYIKGGDIDRNILLSEEIESQAVNGAYETWLGKGCTDFAIAMTAVNIIRAIKEDSGAVFPLSVLLEGQYGEREVYASTLCSLGSDGIKEIYELPLTDSEKERFHTACSELRAVLDIEV